MSQKEVAIIVEGPVGAGKSALLGEVELTLKSLSIPYRWAKPKEAQTEKNMTHADWIGELEATKPSVVLHERILPGKETVLKLIEEGVVAQREGKRVSENPYLSGDEGLNFERAFYWLHGFAGAPAAEKRLLG